MGYNPDMTSNPQCLKITQKVSFFTGSDVSMCKKSKNIWIIVPKWWDNFRWFSNTVRDFNFHRCTTTNAKKLLYFYCSNPKKGFSNIGKKKKGEKCCIRHWITLFSSPLFGIRCCCSNVRVLIAYNKRLEGLSFINSYMIVIPSTFFVLQNYINGFQH